MEPFELQVQSQTVLSSLLLTRLLKTKISEVMEANSDSCDHILITIYHLHLVSYLSFCGTLTVHRWHFAYVLPSVSVTM